MAVKFCRIFENKEGEQLLLRVQPSKEHDGRADLVFTFNLDEHGVVDLTMGGVDWAPAEKMLENYKQENAEEILADPMKFIKSMAGL